MIVQLRRGDSIETDNFFKRPIRKWVRWLRSGKFKKGTGYLCKIRKKGVVQHCCLGVLAESLNYKRYQTYDEQVFSYEELSSEALFNTYEKVCNNYLDWDSLQSFLVYKNDKRGWSFERIADFLEETFLNGGKK